MAADIAISGISSNPPRGEALSQAPIRRWKLSTVYLALVFD